MQATKNKALRRGFKIGAILMVAGAVAYCRPWKHKSPEERAEWLTKRITKELDLNDGQKQTLAKIKEDLLAKHKADKPSRDAEFQEMLALVRSDNLDKAKLADLKKRHLASREQMETLFLDKAAEFHKVLTPAQRTKAADELAKHMKHFSGDK